MANEVLGVINRLLLQPFGGTERLVWKRPFGADHDIQRVVWVSRRWFLVDCCCILLCEAD